MTLACRRSALLLALAALLAACSVRRLAVNGLADALARSSEAFASEEDPELVREALPFALKAIEAVLLEEPEQKTLLIAASAGFAQYGYAFVELDAERIEGADYEGALALRDRALALYLRARDYALRGLELSHPGIGQRLRCAPARAAREIAKRDLDFAYWTGASWGLAIALGKDRPELMADVEVVRALLFRALELDESYGRGAIHEALIAIEALPEAMGGSVARARQHFQRALELNGGTRASTYVALAESVCIPAQDRGEFERLLEAALAVDGNAVPAERLANRLAQDRSRRLLASIDELFLTPVE